jgi:hypothetical protein
VSPGPSPFNPTAARVDTTRVTRRTTLLTLAVTLSLLAASPAGAASHANSLSGADEGDSLVTEAAACTNRYQPLSTSGLAVVVCDQELLKEVHFGDRADAPVADLEPTTGTRQETDPLVVEALDPDDPPAIHPLFPSRALRVYVVVTPPADPSLASSIPSAVLFPPVAVSLSTRLHVAVPDFGPWTLSDEQGRVLASGVPRAFDLVMPHPPTLTLRRAVRQGQRTRVSFTLDRPYDGQALFFAAADGGGVRWQRYVEPRIAYGARTGSFLAHVPKAARRLRLSAYEGFTFRRSKPLVLRAPARPRTSRSAA